MPRYKTTRPVIPLNADRQTIEVAVNEHLLLQMRRYELSDLPHIHRLRTQERVMVNTSTGVVDADMEVSQKWMNRKLPPNDKTTFDMMIWAKEGDTPWEHIGCMGCHSLNPVPVVGYMIREEWWGKSVMTTTLKAFLQVFWGLERTLIEQDTESAEDEHDLYLMKLEMDQSDIGYMAGSDDKDDCNTVPEILLAEIEESNIGSMRVAEKCGFRYRDRESVVEATGTYVLFDYTLTRPVAPSF